MNKVFIITRKKIVICLASFAIIFVLWAMFHILHYKQDSLQQHMKAIEQDHKALYHHMASPAVSAPLPASTSTSFIWKSIQERIKDTVVQVFVQGIIIDIFQPYKTPDQTQSTASGFFFNEDGDILTNAHVVLHARTLWIQVPSFGKEIFDAEVIGMCPDRDVAILRLSEEGRETIRKKLGAIPYLTFGDSDLVKSSDEVLALGYPLGLQSMSSTNGIVSNLLGNWIQTSAALNEGNSGGPLLNMHGEVIGINFAGVKEANNVGWAIPINEIVRILKDLYGTKILPKGVLGAVFSHGSAAMVEYLKNPQPGGYYVVEVLEGGLAQKSGILNGDMIYAFDGHPVDMFGEMNVGWREDKLSLPNYVSRLATGDIIPIVIYRKGERKEINMLFDFSEPAAIKTVYPEYEELDYEIFGGLVVMELTINHILKLAEYAPALTFYADFQKRNEKVLIVTHIFSNALIYRLRMITPGYVLKSVNGVGVKTLAEYRAALRDAAHERFLRLIFTDTVSRISENLLVVLPMEEIIKQESKIARQNMYPMTHLSKTLQELVQQGPAPAA